MYFFFFFDEIGLAISSLLMGWVSVLPSFVDIRLYSKVRIINGRPVFFSRYPIMLRFRPLILTSSSLLSTPGASLNDCP